MNHVFGGGGTAGRVPLLKARQYAGAATPEAPRTRETDQARPARSKPLQEQNRVEKKTGWVNRSERKAVKGGNAMQAEKRCPEIHYAPGQQAADPAHSAGPQSHIQVPTDKLARAPLPERSHPER